MSIAVSASEFILEVQNQNNMAESPSVWDGKSGAEAAPAVVFSLL